MCTPIGPIENNPIAAAGELQKIQTKAPTLNFESTIEEMAPAPETAPNRKTPMQKEVDELCSKLFVALCEVRTKLESISDPAIPFPKENLESAMSELTEIATTVHELDRWKESLANLVRKTIVILPGTHPELDGIVADLTPAKTQGGNNSHQLFKKLARRFIPE